MGGNVLELPTSLVGTGDERGTIIDSGTTLAYLPPMLYDLVLSKVHATCNSKMLVFQ